MLIVTTKPNKPNYSIMLTNALSKSILNVKDLYIPCTVPVNKIDL